MSCLAALTLLLNALLPVAQAQSPALSTPTLTINHIPAYAQIQNSRITADPELCERPKEFQRFVLAHELGHAMADAEYKDTPRTAQQDEMLADTYAARILLDARDDHLPYWADLCNTKQLACARLARYLKVRDQ